MNTIFKIFSLALAALVWSCNSSNGQKDGNLLDAPRFQIKLNKTPNAQLIDVRTPDEYAGGHLKKSKNIDYNGNDFEGQLNTLSKTKPVFVYCLSGGRSAAAANLMRKKGFKQVYELDGGFLKWKNENMPMEGDKTEENNAFRQSDLDKMTAGNLPVLVDFYAPWCGPCKKMEPTLAKLKTEWDGKIKVERIDIDKAVDLTKSMNIDAIPVLAIYVNGKEVKRVTGMKSETDIRNLMQEFLK
jgi:thioredoxin 1